MSKDKQSSIEWLEKEINRRGPKEDNPPQWLQELYEQAKIMHKQEIMDAWYNGFEENRPYVDHSEDYYNETYKQD